jgi:hypothetical protein
MATFNTSSGCVSGICPPFATDTQLLAYTDALDAIIKSPNPSIKSRGAMSFLDASIIGTPAWGGASMTADGTELPKVSVWQLGGSTRAVVYTNASGTSSFVYKNDPSNWIQLIQGGSSIPVGASGATPSGASGATLAGASGATPSGASTTAVAQSGSPYFMVLLAICICICMMIGGGIMFAMKK